MMVCAVNGNWIVHLNLFVPPCSLTNWLILSTLAWLDGHGFRLLNEETEIPYSWTGHMQQTGPGGQRTFDYLDLLEDIFAEKLPRFALKVKRRGPVKLMAMRADAWPHTCLLLHLETKKGAAPDGICTQTFNGIIIKVSYVIHRML